MSNTIGNITHFDRPTARDMHAELKTVLEEFAAKRGLKLGSTGGNFTDTSFVSKIEFVVDGAQDRKSARKEGALEIYAKAYLPGVDLEKTYNHSRLGKVKIFGWNTRAREYPVVIKAESDGKTYKMGIEDVKNLVRRG
jgi:hypothetical protein